MNGTLSAVDRIAGRLLLVGAILHGYGSYLAYPYLSSNLVWALSGSVAALLWLPSISCGSIVRPIVACRVPFRPSSA